MLSKLATLLVTAACLGIAGCQMPISTSQFAAKPLYQDPIFDGAADPVVIWNNEKEKWYMFYTNRRANVDNLLGVEWVHGTPIGIAESDDGVSWHYLGNAKILDANTTAGSINSLPTYWAPDVIFAQGQYHMFLTVVPGIFKDWRHPRSIIHLTSDDLLNWDYAQTLKLNSERVIDADVVALPQGGYRLFYNDEPDGKSVYYADSTDLYDWQDKGKLAIQSRGEGPTAFQWKGYWWLMVDAWQGLDVFRSTDLVTWEKQTKRLLASPGQGPDDGVIGGHPDVIVNKDKAYLFYFTHPGRTPANKDVDDYSTRRSSIQVCELTFDSTWLDCDRDADVVIDLQGDSKVILSN